MELPSPPPDRPHALLAVRGRTFLVSHLTPTSLRVQVQGEEEWADGHELEAGLVLCLSEWQAHYRVRLQVLHTDATHATLAFVGLAAHVGRAVERVAQHFSGDGGLQEIALPQPARKGAAPPAAERRVVLPSSADIALETERRRQSFRVALRPAALPPPPPVAAAVAPEVPPTVGNWMVWGLTVLALLSIAIMAWGSR